MIIQRDVHAAREVPRRPVHTESGVGKAVGLVQEQRVRLAAQVTARPANAGPAIPAGKL